MLDGDEECGAGGLLDVVESEGGCRLGEQQRTELPGLHTYPNKLKIAAGWTL